MVRIFAKGLGTTVQSQVVSKAQKLVFDDTLLNIQHYNGKDQG